MKKNLLSLIVLLGFLTAATDSFDLPAVIDYAQAHSSHFQIIKREYEIDRSKAFQGYGAVLPNLQATYTNSETKIPESALGKTFAQMAGPTANIDPDDISPTKIKTKTTELSASQLLFSFSGLAAWIAAGAAEKLADYNYQDKKEAFFLQVKKSYYDLLIASRMKDVTAKIYEQNKRHAREAEVMFQTGTLAKKDYLDARVAELNSKQQADMMRKNFKLALNSFNNLIGREIEQEIALVTPDVKVIDDTGLTEQDLIDKALRVRPSFKLFKETLRLAEADDINAWGESLPSAYFIYNKQHNEYDVDSQTDGDTETKAISVGWKFFSGGANLHKINEKRNYKEKMVEQEKNVRDLLAIDIKNTLTELRIAGDNVSSAKEALSLAEESQKLAELSFRNGAATQTLYNDAVAQYQAAYANNLKALYDYEYAKNKLNYVVGEKVI